MQFRWPECYHVRRGIEGRPEAIDRAPSPPGYLGNDILDRPASCDLRLRHVLLTNLVEQCQPCSLLALHLGKELLFADGSCAVSAEIRHELASCFSALFIGYHKKGSTQNPGLA